MANTKTMLFEVAKAEVGYLEKKSNSKLGGKTDNAGWANYTKYARDMDNIPDFFNGPKNGYDWCAVFVCWCFMKAYGAVTAMKMLFLPKRSAGASCTYLASRFKAHGKLFATDPQPGDLILYTRDGGRTFYHIGIIANVTDKKIYTIEGNTSGGSSVIANGGGVFEKEYDRKAVTAWYARPDYDPEEAASTPEPAPKDPEPEKKPLEEIARAVIDGKYGDGDDRKLKLYAEGYNPKKVQEEVNRILSGKKPTSAEKLLGVNTDMFINKNAKGQITDIGLKVDRGSIWYQVHTLNGKWLPRVTGYDPNDFANGYAGNHTPIDAIRMYYGTPEGEPYKQARYAVKTENSGACWLPDQVDDLTTNGMDGYAGNFGETILDFRIRVSDK